MTIQKMENYRSLCKMCRHKKGALAIEEAIGVLIVLIVAVLVIFVFYIYNGISESHRQKQVEIAIVDLSADYNLNYFLRFQTKDGKIVSDLINEAYINNDYSKLESLSDNFFNEIYNKQGFGYSITLGKKIIASANLAEILTSSRVQIPLINGETLNVELLVGQPVAIIAS